jgi:hypothetical protein
MRFLPQYKILLFLLVISVFGLENSAFAAPLAQARTSGLKVALESSRANTFRLKIESLAGREDFAHRINILVIENPIRLVIDVAGVSSKASQSIPVKNSKISSLRIGVHPDKTRIVIDVTGIDAPEYEISDNGEVTFSFVGQSADSDVEEPARPVATPKPIIEIKEIPTLPKKEPIAQPTPRIAPTPKPITEVDEDLPPILAPKKKPPPVIEDIEESSSDDSVDEEIPAIAKQPGTGLVKSIYYQTLSDTGAPAVTLDIEGLDSYSLNKRKPDLYELVIQNAHLAGKHLSLPQFPPDTFKGFSVIVGREEGGNVFLKIYVEENVKLFPFVAKGQLWLKVSQ